MLPTFITTIVIQELENLCICEWKDSLFIGKPVISDEPVYSFIRSQQPILMSTRISLGKPCTDIPLLTCMKHVFHYNNDCYLNSYYEWSVGDIQWFDGGLKWNGKQCWPWLDSPSGAVIYLPMQSHIFVTVLDPLKKITFYELVLIKQLGETYNYRV